MVTLILSLTLLTSLLYSFSIVCYLLPFLLVGLKDFNCLPERIDPLLWIFGWFVVIGAISFFLYWTFAWGIVNGPTSLPPWGLYFGLNMLQDIFFTVSYLVSH